MTTASDQAALKAALRKDGVLEFFYTPPPRAQYYRPNGTPLPNLLPGDPYSMQRYLAKGFTLSPRPDAVASPEPAYPDTVVPYVPGQASMDRIDAIATMKQVRIQDLSNEAAGAFEDAEALVVEDATPAALSEAEERAIYEKWKSKYEALNEGLAATSEAAAQSVSSAHPHRFRGAQKGSPCKVEGCKSKRQRKVRGTRS